MKVEYKVNKAGASFHISVGDIENVSEDKGKRLIQIGHAVIAQKDAIANVVIPEEVRKNGKKRKSKKTE